MELDDDALAKIVFFLSTTDARSKLYRLLQYGAKFSKWTLIQFWELENKPRRPSDSSNRSAKQDIVLSDQVTIATSSLSDVTKSSSENWKRRVVASLGRAELVFGDARRFFRFLQFFEMADMFRHVREPARVVRVLRRLRIMCFFLFYLTENYVVFFTRVLGVSPRDPLMRRLRRGCNGFWLMTILLAIPLDHMMQRGTLLSTIKKLLDLPVASVGFSGLRMSDGLFGALGLASAQIGVVSRWLDVMTKFRQQHVKRLGATPDVA